jgi:cytochrome c peroxidase
MKFTRLAGCIPLLFTSFCATQDDADVLFSDTEKEIINTLIYTEPDDDPTSAYDQSSSAATLGQKFFWDTQFSGNIIATGNRNSTTYATTASKLIACVTCHSPSAGWADNVSKPNDVSLGANFTSRNAPTVLNSVRYTYQLWDGSADSPWSLIRAPIEGGPHNFHRYGVAYVICNSDNSGSKANYKAEFEAIFGNVATTAICATVLGTAPSSANSYGKTVYTGLTSTQQGNIDTIFAGFAKAIAAYERLIVSKNSAFDQWAAGNEAAMTAKQKRGLKVFITKGNCIRCHSGANFADGSFHNLGVPQVGGFSGNNDQGRYDGITTLVSGSNSTFNTASTYNDNSATNRVSGLSASSSDIGKFKTPTLRSVSATAPYFHNGTFNSLWDVVNFYNFAGNGGNFPGTKDTILTTRHMTNEEMEDLVSFLGALNGEDLATSLTTTNITHTANSWP